jgi:hypothetical protein
MNQDPSPLALTDRCDELPHRHAVAAGMLARTLRDAVELLGASASPELAAAEPVLPAPSLLQQCLELCHTVKQRQMQPVRLVHHLACSGGTLMCKCISALPNVQLLSEVDPLSALAHGPSRAKFMPTDMIGLLRHSSRGGDDELVVKLFRSSLQTLYEATVSRGQYLLLRDHAHGHFCVGEKIEGRPGLRELLPPELPSLSLLTVRHPVDSFASLRRNRWVHFQPDTVDEYARRYQMFLDHHGDVPIVRYEDFVQDPARELTRICGVLNLPMRESFVDLFDAIELSGDSGRSGSVIEARSRQPEADALMSEAARSEHMQALCKRLDYPLS